MLPIKNILISILLQGKALDKCKLTQTRACVSFPLQSTRMRIDFFAQKGRRIEVLHVQSISCWAPACIGPYSQAYTVIYEISLI